MKILNGLLAVMLLIFAGLQWNDPDAAVWFTIYCLTAIWPAIAALKPGTMMISKPLRLGGFAAIAGCVIGFVLNAGTIGGDWIHVETAREAFGYLICAAVIGISLYTTRGASLG